MTDNNEILSLKQALLKQSRELEKRGQIIMKLEEELKQMQDSVLLITAQNKKLEAMLETAKQERLKFLEDNNNLEEETKKLKKSQQAQI